MSLEAKTSLISDLEARQAELQESIKNAVAAGGDSSKFRSDLKAVQQKLHDARQDVATTQADGRSAAARAAAKHGDELTRTAIASIVDSAAPFASILSNGVPPIDFGGAPALQAVMLNLAHARFVVSEAEARHASAQGEADDLAAKIATKRRRHAELSRLRITGDDGEGSHAELYALAEDEKTLSGMHAEAKTKADNLLPAVNEARIALRTTEGQVSKTESRLFAEHLAEYVKALDRAFMEALLACQAQASKAGTTVGSLVKASHELKAYATTGIVQAPFGRRA